MIKTRRVYLITGDSIYETPDGEFSIFRLPSQPDAWTVRRQGAEDPVVDGAATKRAALKLLAQAIEEDKLPPKTPSREELESRWELKRDTRWDLP